ncbi:MAG TPA: FHA domain-containing protein, partial [Aggregatilineales bacterium]|nr:FHA domain-containing protein [Aggregatilineales bacterium]
MLVQNRSTKGIQPVAIGVSFEWVSGGQIAVFSVKTISRQPIDLWLRWLETLLQDRKSDQPYLVLYDFSDPRFYLTSYIRGRMRGVLEGFPTLRGREAAVVSHGFLADIVRTYMRRDLRTVSEEVQRSIFYDRDTALEWLQEVTPEIIEVKLPTLPESVRIHTGVLTEPTPMVASTTDTAPEIDDIKQRGTSDFPENGILLLEAIDLNRTMRVFPQDSLVLGRDFPGNNRPDIDLVLWAGYRTGVSRRHAKIMLTEDGHLQLYDLVSLNGTYLNGLKLEPYKAYTLHDGDTIRLGRLLVCIRFQQLLDGTPTMQPRALNVSPNREEERRAAAAREAFLKGLSGDDTLSG